MKLQIFAASAHRKLNYSLRALIHSCIIYVCRLCQQLHQQKLANSPTLPQLQYKLHVLCRYTKLTTASNTDKIYKCPKPT